MLKKGFRAIAIVFVFLLLFCIAVTKNAFAGAVITSGPVSLGVNNEGHLIFDNVGITLSGLGDALTPGCP